MLCIKRFEGDFAGAEIGLRVYCNGTGGCGLSSMLQPCPYGWQQGLTAGCQAVARSLAFGAACSYNTGSSARSLGKVWIPSRDGCVPPCKAHSGANCSSKHAHTPLANVPNGHHARAQSAWRAFVAKAEMEAYVTMYYQRHRKLAALQARVRARSARSYVSRLRDRRRRHCEMHIVGRVLFAATRTFRLRTLCACGAQERKREQVAMHEATERSIVTLAHPAASTSSRIRKLGSRCPEVKQLFLALCDSVSGVVACTALQQDHGRRWSSLQGKWTAACSPSCATRCQLTCGKQGTS